MPTRHPDPQAALQAALEDYTAALTAALMRLNVAIATITQTYEADRETLAAIRKLAASA